MAAIGCISGTEVAPPTTVVYVVFVGTLTRLAEVTGPPGGVLTPHAAQVTNHVSSPAG